MAVATAVFSTSKYPNGYDFTSRRGHLYGTLAISASPATYPKGGIPVTLAANATTNGGFSTPGFSNFNSIRGEFYTRSGSGYVYSWTTADLWAATTVYAVGQSVVDKNGNIQTVTTGGTSGGSEPTWALPNSANESPTTTDGSVVWTLQNAGANLGLVQIFQSAGSAAPLVELAQAATIPAGVSGDLISGKLDFSKG